MSERFLKYAPWHAPAASQQIRAARSSLASSTKLGGDHSSSSSE